MKVFIRHPFYLNLRLISGTMEGREWLDLKEGNQNDRMGDLTQIDKSKNTE